MPFKNFDEIIAHVGAKAKKARLAVAAAADAHTLEAVLRAEKEGLIVPVLVGDEEKIRQIYAGLGREISGGTRIVNGPDNAAACVKAVELIREGEADFLMKGAADTRSYLHAVVDKEKGLGCGKLMTHFVLTEVPKYHKLLSLMDTGMVPYPTLEQKKEILQAAADVFFKLGYPSVKAGVLTCVEKINPKMPETVEAAELARMASEGELPGITVAGPISYDCAMNKEIAELKGYESDVAGDPDILLFPDIHAGNILGKCLTVTCGALMAGFIVGTICPVVMTSRGSSMEEKYHSIVLAAGISA